MSGPRIRPASPDDAAARAASFVPYRGAMVSRCSESRLRGLLPGADGGDTAGVRVERAVLGVTAPPGGPR